MRPRPPRRRGSPGSDRHGCQRQLAPKPVQRRRRSLLRYPQEQAAGGCLAALRYRQRVTPGMELSPEQKRQLFDDGYVVIKQAVAAELVEAAQARLEAAGQHTYQNEPLEMSDEFCDLVNQSSLDPILREAMGPFTPVTRGFAATIFPARNNGTLALGRDGDRKDSLLPNEPDTAPKRPPNGGGLHVDGVPSFTVDPQSGYFGPPSATTLGSNRTPHWMDPDMTLSICSFSCFVGICLSDQSEPDRGNLVVLKGAHHHCQNFFRWQHEQGGPIGPEGPGWPRVVQHAETGEWQSAPSGAVQYTIKQDPEQYLAKDQLDTATGSSLLAEPMQVLMDPGDAVFVMHATPHSGSHNSWTEARKTIYFRLVHEKRMANHKDKTVTGRSDHMIRGWDGEFLEAEDGLPSSAVYETTVASLLDHWSEWDGMIETVTEGRAWLQREGVAPAVTAAGASGAAARM